MSTAVERVWNFSPGPAVLPVPVLEQVRDELLALPGCGVSILEISHRSPRFREILQSAEDRLRRLLGIPAGYRVLFLQGGARLQFAMVPLNLLQGTGRRAEYVVTGSWSSKAAAEARCGGESRVVWDGKSQGYDRLPDLSQLELDAGAAYVYVASNETIQGVQFPADLDGGSIPLVCDSSSDFVSRPVPVSQYGLIYACAQKNAGPAGVTTVIIRGDLLERSGSDLPGYLNYRAHADENSLYNTPPTFAVYVMELVLKWLEEEVGGLAEMERRNRSKAQQLYREIDDSGGFYRGHARPECRSLMNVTFRLADGGLEERFLSEAESQGLASLAGHRSVGGVRASIYNAMPAEGVECLAGFMRDFARRHG